MEIYRCWKDDDRDIEIEVTAVDKDENVCKNGADVYAKVEWEGKEVRVGGEEVEMEEEGMGVWRGEYEIPEEGGWMKPGVYEVVFGGVVKDRCDDHAKSDDADVGMGVYKVKVVVVRVELEQVDDNSPLKPKNRMCVNAQGKYKDVKYRVRVEPGECTVKLKVEGGGVRFADGAEEKAGLRDGSMVRLVAPDELKEGDYEWRLKAECEQYPSCGDEVGDMVFGFVSVHNTKSIPSIRQSSADEVTDTSAGGNHDGGYALVRWSKKDTDSIFLELAGIGDNSMDVQPDVSGWAKNYQEGKPTSAKNNVEFWAGMNEIGIFEVGTIPVNAYQGRISVEANISLTAQGVSQGYASMFGTITIGPSLWGIIGFSVGTPVTLSGRFVCAGGIGLYWDTQALNSSDNTFTDSWRGIDPWMRGEEHYLEVKGTVAGEGTVPLKVPFGFSAGVSLKENMRNPLLTGTSHIFNMKLEIRKVKFRIVR